MVMFVSIFVYWLESLILCTALFVLFYILFFLANKNMLVACAHVVVSVPAVYFVTLKLLFCKLVREFIQISSDFLMF